MALRTKKKIELRNLKPVLLTCAVVVGAGVLIVNTFPHLKTTLHLYLQGGTDDEPDEDEEEEARSISGETVIVESIHRDPQNENKTIDSFQVVR